MKAVILLTFLLGMSSALQAGLPLYFSFDRADAVACGTLGEPTGIMKEVKTKTTARPESAHKLAMYRLNIEAIVNYRRTIILPDGSVYPEEAKIRRFENSIRWDKGQQFIEVALDSAPSDKDAMALWFLEWSNGFQCYIASAPVGVDGAHFKILKAYMDDKSAKKDH